MGVKATRGFPSMEIVEQLDIRFVGQKPERQLPQGSEIVPTEEVVQRLRDLLRRVDVAVEKAAAELLGGRVNEFDLVRLAEYPIGHSLPDLRIGDLLYRVGDALE